MIGPNPRNRVLRLSATRRRASIRGRPAYRPTVEALEASLRKKTAELRREQMLREECEQRRQSVMTRAQYRKLQFCLHPDRVAAFQDVEMTARYTEAFRWLVGQSVRETTNG